MVGIPALFLFLTPGLRDAAFARDPTGRIEFNRDVRPILSENCYSCHGPDKSQRKAKLRLDERATATKHGAIVPGSPDDSDLVLRILSEDDDVMPPRSSHKSLSDDQKKTLQAWISQGAEYQDHWAYVIPTRPSIPEVRREAWVRNPVDAFLLSSLESRGIEPSPEAAKDRLIRRLSLDLIGLPPTSEEVSAFQIDTDPRAYERLVDRLLDSPHYGERMAVGWLDLARFTDTVGYHGDQGQRVFPYRDYVIDSFNRNKPFDVFATEQLAGDLLPDPTPEQLVATGFNRLNMMTREGGAQPEEYLAKYAADRVRTVGLTFLGSTLGCAECHDHKFDPFTQRDFYALSAFFADVKQWGVYNDYDYTPNPELKGWSNDHPFPPEIEVESRYLKDRRDRLMDELRQVASAHADPVALDAWFDQARSTLEAETSGWVPLDSESTSPEAGTLLPDGSLLVRTVAKSDPTSRANKAADHRFKIDRAVGWISRIRVELLPHEDHRGRITRDGSEVATVSLSASVKSQNGKERSPLKFYLADADLKSPRYFNGDEVPGVLAGWRTSSAHSTETHTAVWCLDPPVLLQQGESLEVAIKSPQAGCVRVSMTPFGLPDDGHLLRGPDAEERAAFASSDVVREPGQDDRLRRLFHLSTAADLGVWQQLRELGRGIFACRDGRAFSMVTQATTPSETRVLPRGDWQNRTGEIVAPEVPRFLPHESVAADRRLTRLDLAHWIASPENPLTARVFMNRLWKQVFGVGISQVMEDVGGQGEWPVHPELLDWLAVEFRESGWDVKRMVKLLVTSSAYRQDSRGRPDLKELDPGNRWVSFLSPRRLEAEFVRDNALAVAGLLSLDVGGPSSFPYQPAGYYANLQFPDRTYVASDGELQYRRGVYSHWQRTFLHPMLANFDAPAREECTPARNVANTPQQALTLLNDPTFVEAARSLAAGLLENQTSMTDEDRLGRLFLKVLARPIEEAERLSLVAFLAERREFYRQNPEAADAILKIGQAPVPKDVDPAEVAAWATTCRVVLNLHETITRY
ncbi:PSD1 and planctomycete cytochrome C domain-containing protein [Planctomyces sp. SH-PL62]|uniref:PSD1 and planctomycete cytochrome C domain-containing protein n=1 Tax=Planctomyces sp. SH-PL62 TaxID=1636152 RepID=UPI0018D3923D|nr:PSD1 and planctomycete cytochrome C domain-containing protein [Planctomyces sp. SH-PL62]